VILVLTDNGVVGVGCHRGHDDDGATSRNGNASDERVGVYYAALGEENVAGAINTVSGPTEQKVKRWG
jgi:hypothetical protein